MSYNPFSLENKVVLITGASSGIGRSTAIECSKLGATLVITARNEERLKETLSLLEGDGHSLIVADLSSESDIINLVSKCPNLDGIVNNAGQGRSKPIKFVGLNDLQEVFETNMYAVALLTKYLLKQKKLNKGGSIVFTSSLSSHVTAPGLSVYASSKAAVCAYMRTCALEFGNFGIRANAILPGMVETRLINSGTYTEDDKQQDLSLYPLGRYGNPIDIALAIVFLLSDASKWITGSELIIDGGRSLK